jgi:hypothetical protein
MFLDGLRGTDAKLQRDGRSRFTIKSNVGDNCYGFYRWGHNAKGWTAFRAANGRVACNFNYRANNASDANYDFLRDPAFG